MSQLPKIFKPTVARLHNDVPPVLHTPDFKSASGQTGRVENVSGDPAMSREPWPGCSLGIRAPSVGETPLSVNEVEHYLRIKNL